MFSFHITSSDPSSHARTGTFSTPHGEIHTPCFMPCGTKGAVKTLTPDELKTLGSEIILANTYHLMLRPGAEIISQMGGLHTWMRWDRPILTDSGGFQVFSLATLRKITDEGVTFQSHIDGSTHLLTPEKSIEIQEKLGADIIMAFDECPPGDCDYAHARTSLNRTTQWLKRSMAAHKRTDQALFPIIQGASFKELRIESAQQIVATDPAGIAIGGLAVGEEKSVMYEMIATVTPLLPSDRPHYLMGVGEPEDIIEAVSLGIDMFDCVIPTRLARHGTFFTKEGKKNIDRREYLTDETALESGCVCYTCSLFSKSYLRHLMQEKEILGHRLLTIHNLHFLVELTRKIRTSIQDGTFHQVRKNFYKAV